MKVQFSTLNVGQYFKFLNGNKVYRVIDIKYVGNYNGDFFLYYQSIDTTRIYKWSTYQIPRFVFCLGD